MSHEQRIRWLRDVVERAGPRVQVDLLLLVEPAQAVVEVADAQLWCGLPGDAVQVRQRAVFRSAGRLPAREVREGRAGPRFGAVGRGRRADGLGGGLAYLLQDALGGGPERVEAGLHVAG